MGHVAFFLILKSVTNEFWILLDPHGYGSGPRSSMGAGLGSRAFFMVNDGYPAGTSPKMAGGMLQGGGPGSVQFEASTIE